MPTNSTSVPMSDEEAIPVDAIRWWLGCIEQGHAEMVNLGDLEVMLRNLLWHRERGANT